MTDRPRPFQFFQLFLSENLRNQAHALVLEKGLARAVARDDAGAFLPAMLQREQAVIGQDRRIWMTKYAERARTRAAGMLRVRTILGAGGV